MYLFADEAFDLFSFSTKNYKRHPLKGINSTIADYRHHDVQYVNKE